MPSKAVLDWVDPQTLTEPVDGATVIVARNWWYLANEAGQVAVYRHHYVQGNRDKAVVEHFLARDYTPGGTQAIQIPLAFLPWRT